MAIFTIGDLHLSLGTEKPMDVFTGWQDYVARLTDNWHKTIAPQDTVVLAGDTSWAMKLPECTADFTFLQNLPGRKILLKGNHDYWWTTLTKMNAYLAAQNFTSLSFLFNNSILVDDLALCGTRSWFYDIGQAQDEKIMNREKGRLIASLQAAGEHEKIVFLHYPPLSANAQADEIVSILHEYGVKRCYYGHLHGGSIPYAMQGTVDGIAYKLISADALQFNPLKIC
ncbi:MAG: metallophosphoesterase [Ruthenibacterium sp.]